MKTALALACSVIFFPISLKAQNPPTEGQFSFVFAVPSVENTQVTIDGKNPNPKGMRCGFVTTGLITSLGDKVVEAANGELKSKAITVQVTREKSPIIAIGLDQAERQGDTPPEKFLRIQTVHNLPAKEGWNYQMIFLSPQGTIRVAVNGEPIVLNKWEEQTISTTSGSITIESEGFPVAHFNPIEPGNFLIVLYTNPAGKLSACLASDAVFSR